MNPNKPPNLASRERANTPRTASEVLNMVAALFAVGGVAALAVDESAFPPRGDKTHTQERERPIVAASPQGTPEKEVSEERDGEVGPDGRPVERIGEVTIDFSKPESAGPAFQEALEVVAARALEQLLTYAEELRDNGPAFKMLSATDVRSACTFSSEWFVEQQAELQTVWGYIRARQSSWPKEFGDNFGEIAEELRRIPGPVRWLFNIPDTQEKVVEATTRRVAQTKPFNCAVASQILGVEKLQLAQRLGRGIMLDGAALIVRDFVLAQREGKAVSEEAVAAADALGKAIAAARGDK